MSLPSSQTYLWDTLLLTRQYERSVPEERVGSKESRQGLLQVGDNNIISTSNVLILLTYLTYLKLTPIMTCYFCNDPNYKVVTQ